MLEVWKPLVTIKEVAGQFEISNLGRIRRVASFNQQQKSAPEYKKCRINKTGYVYAQFWYNGGNHPVRLHRLVALHFVPNPNNYKEVNHKDGDKMNNCDSNLEWVSCSQNNLHKFRVLGRSPHRWSDEEKKYFSEKSKAYHARVIEQQKRVVI